jgi:hypothetical protein
MGGSLLLNLCCTLPLLAYAAMPPWLETTVGLYKLNPVAPY